MPESRNFLYFNRAGKWPGFSSSGLVAAADGTLSLENLAQLDEDLPVAVAALSVPAGPGGVALDRDGNLYWTDPAQDRIFCRSACDGSISQLACLGSSGTSNGRLSVPRGLAIPCERNALFVADSGNHRLQVFDLESSQVAEIWPRSSVSGQPAVSLREPWSCASDAGGNLYVLDHGAKTVQKFFYTGDPDLSFSQNVAAAGVLVAPMSLAAASSDNHVRICVADPGSSSIFFFDGDGVLERDAAGHPVTIALGAADIPLAIAADWNSLYIGENYRKRILQYRRDDTWNFVGEVRGYQGTCIALAISSSTTAYASPGAGLTPLRISLTSGFIPLGAAWSSRIDLGYPVKWHELIAEFVPLPALAHLEVFAYASASPDDTPNVSFNAAERTFFFDPRWQRAVRGNVSDVTAVYIGSPDPHTPKLQYLWVGAELHTEGASTPILQNLRIEFNQDGYLPLLPAIYAGQKSCQEFLPRLLALFQGFFEGVESEIANLPRLFNPSFVPISFLPWLADWLGLDLDQSWPEAKQREAIAEAFAWFARRGTRKGLEHSILFRTGIQAVVEEPILQTGSWCLPSVADACCHECAEFSAETFSDDSELGWTTVLAAQPDGAIIGSTAILDQSTLTLDQDFGAPLFSDVAYRFSVLVPRSAVSNSGLLVQLRSVIESEMPAHTAYQLCILDPQMRIGYQCRVGLDSIVAGPPPTMRLGETAELAVDAVLGGPHPATLGQDSRVGISARIT